MKQVYLLTGRPGTGKTTIIRNVVAGMGNRAGGFYTEEIRHQGARQGFRLVTLDGQSTILAHIDIRSPYRVSRYGVDLVSFENTGISALERAAQQNTLVVIDEIGKMELFSHRFRETVAQLIDSDYIILGTIMFNPDPWTDIIKNNSRVKLVEVTRTNHRAVLAELHHWLQSNRELN
jgi:nucleoside-triphosphatase